MRVIEPTQEHARAFSEHLVRHFQESGRDGDLIFHPMLEYAPEAPEKIEKSWALKPPALGWVKSFALIDDDGRILGHAALRSPNIPAASHRCTFGMGLERSARAQGYGRKLCDQTFEWAEREPSLEWIDLYVFAHNEAARKLYASCGFREVGQVEDLFRIGATSVSDIHMVLKLPARPLA